MLVRTIMGSKVIGINREERIHTYTHIYHIRGMRIGGLNLERGHTVRDGLGRLLLPIVPRLIAHYTFVRLTCRISRRSARREIYHQLFRAINSQVVKPLVHFSNNHYVQSLFVSLCRNDNRIAICMIRKLT